MKNIKYLLIIAIMLFTYSYGFSVSASINHAIYKDVTNGKFYIEIYTTVIGQSVVFVKNDQSDDYISTLQSTIIIKQGEDIIDFKKYNFASPNTASKIDFSDVTRMYLPEGSFVLDVELIDMNDETNTFRNSIDLKAEASQLSSLRLLSHIENTNEALITSKNGVNMLDLTYNRYFDDQKTFISYFELYPDVNDTYSYISYEIIDQDIIVLKKIKRYENKTVVPCLLTFDISQLVSGSYTYKVSLVNKDESVITSKSILFTRSNQAADMLLASDDNDLYKNSFVNDIDQYELDYYLKALSPICSSLERKILSNAISSNESKIKRYALYEYWERTTNNKNTKAQFDAYMNVAKAVDKKYYSGFGYGFETDRGYIFLKYGQPNNTIVVTNEPSAPPYEMWVYAYLEETKENDIKFVFYSPSLSDDFELLHSNSKNELSNKNWLGELYKKATNDLSGNRIDGIEVEDNWNRKAEFYYNNL